MALVRVRSNIGRMRRILAGWNRLLIRGPTVRRWLYQGARVYERNISQPAFFYSRARTPQRGRRSRSRGRSIRSVRAVRHSEALRLSGPPRQTVRGRPVVANAKATVVMGDKKGSTHARILEAGRRARPFYPGKTGALPGQRIFGRGLQKFRGVATVAVGAAVAATLRRHFLAAMRRA